MLRKSHKIFVKTRITHTKTNKLSTVAKVALTVLGYYFGADYCTRDTLCVYRG